MSNYKITSADFFTPGDTGEPDAYMSPEDLAAIKANSGSLTGFLQAQVAARLANNILPENITTIEIREQKFDATTKSVLKGNE